MLMLCLRPAVSNLPAPILQYGIHSPRWISICKNKRRRGPWVAFAAGPSCAYAFEFEPRRPANLGSIYLKVANGSPVSSRRFLGPLMWDSSVPQYSPAQSHRKHTLIDYAISIIEPSIRRNRVTEIQWRNSVVLHVFEWTNSIEIMSDLPAECKYRSLFVSAHAHWAETRQVRR